MNQISSANRFIDAMFEAEGKLSNVKKAIDMQRTKAQEIVERYSTEQQIIVNGVGTELEQRSDMTKAIFGNYRSALETHINENKIHYSNYIEGMDVIKEFEKTFIVSVFGKVKSGKSYLGNYMMGNSFKKYCIASNYDKLGTISVQRIDKGKFSTANAFCEYQEETDGQGFGVGSTEATSSIQFFKLGGLTWFDTPGIGSITKENEELAEEYIKNSDLVVFCMNSDAAGTQQEFSELKALFEMNKPLLLLITQSDTNDFDIDENGDIISVLIPKSDKDRSDVEKYIMDEIRKSGMSQVLELSNNKVLTVSTKLASEALAKSPIDSDMYKGSNIDQLIELLIDITQNEAAKLKEKNPKERFNTYIDDLLTEINAFIEKVAEINTETTKIIEKAADIKQIVLGNVRFKAMGIIHERVQRATIELQNNTTVKQTSTSVTGILGQITSCLNEQKAEEKTISGQQIANDIADEINKIIRQECVEGMMELIPNVDSMVNSNILSGNDMSVADLSDRKQSTSYEVEVLHRSRIDRDGLIGKIKDWFMGHDYETTTTIETRTVEFTVGNNAMDIEDQTVMYFEKICDTKLDSMINSIINGSVKPIEIIFNEFTLLANQTKHELENLKI